jgi:hypothetical protein
MSPARADLASAGMSVFYFDLSFYITVSGCIYIITPKMCFYNATFPNICSVHRKLIDQLAARLSQNGY